MTNTYTNPRLESNRIERDFARAGLDKGKYYLNHNNTATTCPVLELKEDAIGEITSASLYPDRTVLHLAGHGRIVDLERLPSHLGKLSHYSNWRLPHLARSLNVPLEELREIRGQETIVRKALEKKVQILKEPVTVGE
jgi:hypothetical protein